LLIQLGFEDAKQPFALQFVADGIAATDYLSRRGSYVDVAKYPDPCILVTDLKMPRMNGFELISWVRSEERWRALPIVVVSGSDQPQDRERALSLGANEYVVKDLVIGPKSSLIGAISRHCQVPAETARLPTKAVRQRV